MSTNPNQILSEKIIKELLQKGLISKASEKAVMQGISQGTIKEADWKTYLQATIANTKTATDETK